MKIAKKTNIILHCDKISWLDLIQLYASLEWFIYGLLNIYLATFCERGDVVDHTVPQNAFNEKQHELIFAQKEKKLENGLCRILELLYCPLEHPTGNACKQF